MNLKHISTTVGALTLILAFALQTEAQSSAGVGSTWSQQSSLLITDALVKNSTGKTSKVKAAKASALKFKPTKDSGVAKTLADALGRNAAEKATLKEAFLQIKQGYESEVAKAGKSNDLAAAMTFFIASNVMAHHQRDEPSDQASDTLFVSLQKIMAGIPEFAKMPNREKQKLHDWLVIMAGYVMTGYADAKQSGNAVGLANFKEMADYSLRLVLGIGAAKLSFSATGLSIESTRPASNPKTDSATDNAGINQIVGVWSKSASSPWSLAPVAILTNNGYYKGRYIFAANGTYNFKGESWGGHMRSNEFWTIEESGTYSVNGTALTISPKASKRTLRNRDGVVQKIQKNALEEVTYGWKLHYFEGIKEMNLVLQTEKPVARDGAFSSNDLFLNSYLYGRNNDLEWRF